MMKYQQLASLLREELLRNGQQGRKLPTELQLTQQHRVSRQTVRHALRLLEEEGLIRRRQGSGAYATGLSGAAASRQIAVMLSFPDDYIFPAILHDALSLFSQRGYSTLVRATGNRVEAEGRVLESLLSGQACALLAEGVKTALPSPNLPLYQRLLGAGLPMVFFHGAPLPGLPCVSDDNFGGGQLLTQHLLARGRREIAGLFKSDDLQGPQRYHGVISALRSAGAPIRDSRFAWYDTEDRRRMLEEKDTALLSRFLRERLGDAGAVICHNDEIASLLIGELLAAGRRVPEEVAVVSFDNSYYSQIGPVPITSLRHPGDRVGRLAAERLVNLLEGKGAESKVLSWELVERNSSG